jgi:hypothetical protein
VGWPGAHLLCASILYEIVYNPAIWGRCLRKGNANGERAGWLRFSRSIWFTGSRS